MKMDLKVVQRANEGSTGGLILFWCMEVNVPLLFSYQNYIDVTIMQGNTTWRFKRFMGNFNV
jgi:hypothetical protein